MAATSLSLRLATALAAGSISLAGYAGSWSSGGGEILEHAQNPWFLETGHTSPPIHYCVVSASDFAVEQGDLEALVESAFTWWDDQLSNAYYPDNRIWTSTGEVNYHVMLNTSRIQRDAACTDATDLAFQFGHLAEPQRQEFDRLHIDLTRFVALTIRTDYGSDLRGKGFIYVSPDRGPQAFRGQNIVSNAWTEHDTDHVRLRSVLTHELGHVFGLSHAGCNDSIMSARFAESIVSLTYPYAPNSGLFGAVFFPSASDSTNMACDDEHTTYPRFREYFEIPAEARCFRMRWSLNSLIVDASGPEENSPFHRIGIARFPDGGDRRHTQLVTLWLPAGQSVFPGIPTYISSLLGPAASEVQSAATFTFEQGGRSKPIFVQASPRYFQIGGVTAQGIVPDLLPVGEYGRALSGWGSR